MNNFQKQLNESDLLPYFAVEVVDKEGHTDYIECYILVSGGQLLAQRDAVNSAEQQSQHIAKTSVDIDEDFSLDSHLELLLEEVNYDIIEGDLYTLVG